MRWVGTKPSTKTNRRQLIRLIGATGLGSTLTSMNATAVLDDEDNDGDESEVTALPFWTDAPDGTTLRGHVHVREDLDALTPVILVMRPYWNVTGTPTEEALDDDTFGDLFERLLDERFAVAAVNSRGTGESDGCFQYWGPNEWDDPNAVIEKLADEPYCNGRVGMLGYSTEGNYNIATALAGETPEPLEAIVAAHPVFDWFTVQVWNGTVLADSTPALDSAFYTQFFGGVPNDAAFLVDRATCTDQLDHSEAGVETTSDTGVKNDWFEARNLTEYVRKSEVPMFITHPFPDELEPSALLAYQLRGLFESRPSHITRIEYGQWPHGEGIDPIPDFSEKALAWFDHLLKDNHPGRGVGRYPDAVRPGIVTYKDDTGEQHSATQWPIVDDAEMLFLSEDGATTDVPSDTSERSFRAINHEPTFDEEMCNEQTQLLYTSQPLGDDVRLVGAFTASLTIESTAEGSNLSVILYKTSGEGVCGDENVEEFARLHANLRHFEQVGDPQSFPTGEPVRVEFESFPFATQLDEGDRIVATISGGAEELLPDENIPELTVHSGPDYASGIELPVVEGNLDY